MSLAHHFTAEADMFKDAERGMRQTLPSNSYAVIRFDGKNFSTFTKQFAAPYDLEFMAAMDEAALAVAEVISGAKHVYVQSDEISVIFSDKASQGTQHAFGGRVEKLLSIGAATVTVAFLRALEKRVPSFIGTPVFDARVHALEDADKVERYIRWRRRDAQKNAVTMAAQTFRSHKQLMNLSTPERLEVLAGTELERLPEGFYNGRLGWKQQFQAPVPEEAKKRAERAGAVVPEFVLRKRWVLEPATRALLEDRF